MEFCARAFSRASGEGRGKTKTSIAKVTRPVDEAFLESFEPRCLGDGLLPAP